MTKLLGISGSLRAASYNTMLVHEAARAFGPDHFQMADLNLPLFNEDVEAQGMPAAVQTVCEQIDWADALVISTPEYNKGPSGVIKNMLDWVSRPRPAPMVGKPGAVVAGTAGLAGGERARSAMCVFLVPFMVRAVYQPEVHVGSASANFDGEGRLSNDQKKDALVKLMAELKAEIPRD